MAAQRLVHLRPAFADCDALRLAFVDRSTEHPSLYEAARQWGCWRHDTGRWKNNRAENSHQPLRQRERREKRFKCFLSTHAAVYNVFNIQRHLISRGTLCVFRNQAMLTWRQATVAA
jgi:putative transposase